MLNNRKILSFSTLIVFVMTGLLFSCNRQNVSDQIVGETSLRVTETAIFTDKPVSSPTIIAPSEPPPLPTPTATASATSTPPPSATATATSFLFATVTPLEEWLVYENAFYGYQISYPPEANIGIVGVIDFPADEKPENLSYDAYLDQLKETYPGDICVVITYMTGFVTIRAPRDNGGRYVSTCLTFGIGAEYDIIEKTEVVMVNGEPYTAEGVELHRPTDKARGAVRELLHFHLPDGTQIHYGRAIGFSDEDGVKEVLLQIMSTFSRSAIMPTATPTAVTHEQLNDEERATQEAQVQQATIEAGTEAGEFGAPSEELDCEVEAVESPSLYLLCGNDIVPAPSSIPFIGAETLVEAEALLTSYVYELLGEVSATNESAGYESYFSAPNVLKALILTGSGDVILDFNEKFAEQHGQLHGSTAARMLEQLNRTIFQFREVNSISVTLTGSCEAFAQLFEFSCVNLDRDTWQRVLELNSDQVETFNLMEE